VNGLQVNDLRPYTRHCFEQAWPVREECLMEPVLELLIEPTTRPPSFRLTVAEFCAAISESAKRRTDTAEAFRERLRLQIQGTHGRLPDDRESVQWQLQRAEIREMAPAYICESRLPVRVRYALWKISLEHSWVNKLLDGEDEETLRQRVDVAKHRLAVLEQLPPREDESLDGGVRRLLAEQVQEQRLQEALENCTEGELARAVAERVPLYDGTHDRDAIERMIMVLAQLTKAELVFLDDCAKFGQWRASMVAMVRRMAGLESPEAPLRGINPESAG
jgi:hypothetical protein